MQSDGWRKTDLTHNAMSVNARSPTPVSCIDDFGVCKSPFQEEESDGDTVI